jgi:hypothetical protein
LPAELRIDLQGENAMNEAAMSEALEQPEQLSRAERLHLTWALAWPCSLLSLLYGVLRGQLRLSDGQLQGIDQVFGILFFFLFTTWVVRRTVRLNFPWFHLEVIRGDAPDGTRMMRYSESLSVGWLITWRTMVILLPLIIAVAVVWVGLHRQPHELSQESHSPLGTLLSTLAELPVFYFWIVKAAVNKRYRRFSLRLERSAVE